MKIIINYCKTILALITLIFITACASDPDTIRREAIADQIEQQRRQNLSPRQNCIEYANKAHERCYGICTLTYLSQINSNRAISESRACTTECRENRLMAQRICE